MRWLLVYVLSSTPAIYISNSHLLILCCCVSAQAELDLCISFIVFVLCLFQKPLLRFLTSVHG